MPHSTARFEFRTFAPALDLVGEKLRRLGQAAEISESGEIYLIVFDAVNQNVKLRDGKLEMKQLLTTEDGLEQWEPVAAEPLPIARDCLAKILFSEKDPQHFELRHQEYSQDELLQEIVGRDLHVWAAAVFKRRFRYKMENCLAEIDEVRINGAAIASIAVESEAAEAVLRYILLRIAVRGAEPAILCSRSPVGDGLQGWVG